MNKDPLPSEKQRELLCDMIHEAFIELRVLGAAGLSEQSHDLAYAFHNIPKEMYGWGSFSWEAFRKMLARYQHKWRVAEAAHRARLPRHARPHPSRGLNAHDATLGPDAVLRLDPTRSVD